IAQRSEFRRLLDVITERRVATDLFAHAFRQHAGGDFRVVRLVDHQHHRGGDGKVVELLGSASVVEAVDRAFCDLERLDVLDAAAGAVHRVENFLYLYVFAGTVSFDDLHEPFPSRRLSRPSALLSLDRGFAPALLLQPSRYSLATPTLPTLESRRRISK